MNDTYDAKNEIINFDCFKTLGYDVKLKLIQEILYKNCMISELFLLYFKNEKFRPFIDLKNLNLKITKDNDIYFEKNSEFNDRDCIINMEPSILMKFENMLANKDITINKLYVEGMSHFTSQLPNYANWTRFSNVCLHNYRSYEKTNNNSKFEFHFHVTDELVDGNELYNILERIKSDNFNNNNNYKIYLNFDVFPLIRTDIFYEVYDFADRLFDESFHDIVQFKTSYQMKYRFSYYHYINSGDIHDNSSYTSNDDEFFKSFYEEFTRYYHINTDFDIALSFNFNFGNKENISGPSWNEFVLRIIEYLNSILGIPLLKRIQKIQINNLKVDLVINYFDNIFEKLDSWESLVINNSDLFFTDLFKRPRDLPKLRKIEIYENSIYDEYYEKFEMVEIPKSIQEVCLRLHKDSYKIFGIIKGRNIKILKIYLDNYAYDFKYLDMSKLEGLEIIEFIIYDNVAKIKIFNFNRVPKSLKEIKLTFFKMHWDCLLALPDLDAKYLLGLYTNTSILGSNFEYVHKKRRNELCEINYETGQIFS